MPKFFSFPSKFTKIYHSFTVPFFPMLIVLLFLFQLFCSNFSGSSNSQFPDCIILLLLLSLDLPSNCLNTFPGCQTLNVVSLTASIVHSQYFDPLISQISHVIAPRLSHTWMQWKGYGNKGNCPRHGSAAASQHPGIPG